MAGEITQAAKLLAKWLWSVSEICARVLWVVRAELGWKLGEWTCLGELR